MARFVAIFALLAACAQGSSEHGATDGGVDGTMVDGKKNPVDAAAPDGCVATPETCNQMDDDCDGATDEDLDLGMPCDGPDTDGCKEGVIVCDGSGGTKCNDTTDDDIETCNGLDDDCQNGIDDGFNVDGDCTVGVGACQSIGKLVCKADGTGTECTAMSGAMTAETCGNGIDEDCNGADATCPANDMPAGAIDISAGGVFMGNLLTSHDDVSASGSNCGLTGGRDLFYKFTLPAEEVVYYDTFSSDFDTVVRIYAGACTSIGTPLVCSDDALTCNNNRQSIGAVDLTAGTYCLVVDQYSSNTSGGAVNLTFKRGGRPGVPLPNASGTYNGSTIGKANLSKAGCENNTNQPDVGHFWISCPNATYTVDASTCSSTTWDTVLYMRNGNATTADIACSDDVSGCGDNLQSRITGAAVTGPNLHWIIVDGYGTSGNGDYSLTYSIH